MPDRTFLTQSEDLTVPCLSATSGLGKRRDMQGKTAEKNNPEGRHDGRATELPTLDL